MRCCVSSCKNDSRHSSKSQGITFHAFPTTSSHRDAWLKALGREQWRPKERSAVCSEHFLLDDLYVTKNGLRKVRAGAVPLISQDVPTAYKFDTDSAVQACRMCLATDCRLLSIRRYDLGQAFEKLTGLSVLEDYRLPQKLCSECSQRLVNADNFRSRSHRAHSLLVEILNKQQTLTTDTVRTINRDTHNFASPLLITLYPPNHYNYEYTHTDETEEAKPKTEEPIIEALDLEVDFRNEDQIFVDEIKEFDNNFDQGNNDFGQGNNDFGQGTNDFCQGNNDFGQGNNDFDQGNNDFGQENNDLGQENNDIGQENNDFCASDNENDTNFVADKEFETDDSLPLEVTRKKKKKGEGKRKRSLEKETVQKVRKNVKKTPTEPKIDRRRKPFLNQDLNETLFTVTNLTFEEQIAEIQKRQDSDNYKHSVFKCTECFKGFLDQDAYTGHMTRHTNECGDHQCEICKTHFKHSHALRKHITAHHTQRFSCNQCPYVTTHRQTARLHERWHKGTRYRCPHCPEEFVKFTTYMGHVRIKHPSDFVCALCGYSFVSGKGIELHKKLKHRQAQPIPEDGPFCEQCNVRFASQEAYRKHLSVSARHTTKETREANKANKGRKTREMREREKASKEEGEDEGDERRSYPSQLRKAEGPIPCEQCGLQLEDSRAYHGHFRRAHPDKNRTNYPSMKSPCMCELCGRIFQSYALLKDHTWTHTGERPFSCGECGKSFRMKQRLVAHRRVHALVRASYACQLCGKDFSTHSNRQRHMFIHTGLKPFKCEMCGKGFKHASEKRAHVTYVHLKKPWPKRSRGKRHGRQGSVPPAEASPELALPPAWPACQPKMPDINILDDKPVYYNLKI